MMMMMIHASVQRNINRCHSAAIMFFFFFFNLCTVTSDPSGPGSVVGIATGYGLTAIISFVFSFVLLLQV